MPCASPNAVYLYYSNGTYMSNVALTYPSNGIAVDSAGKLISCIYGYSNILEIVSL